MLGIQLQRGDRVRLETPGGGGYGDPAGRAPEAREHDRKMGYVGDIANNKKEQLA
ncbi:hypothetical protein D3C71_1897840 [compost metagenome]